MTTWKAAFRPHAWDRVDASLFLPPFQKRTPRPQHRGEKVLQWTYGKGGKVLSKFCFTFFSKERRGEK